MQKCSQDRRKLQKYEHTEITLDDDQSEEMAQIVDIISNKSPEVLTQVFEEAPAQGKVLGDTWKSDIRS